MHAELPILPMKLSTTRHLSVNGYRALIEGVVRLADLAGLTGAAILTTYWRFGDQTVPDTVFTSSILGCLLAVKLLAVCKMYSTEKLRSLRKSIPETILGWSGAVMILIVVLFIFKTTEDLSRLWLGVWYLGGAIVLLAIRIVTSLILNRIRIVDALLPRVLVIGTRERLEAAVDCLVSGNSTIRVHAAVGIDHMLTVHQPSGEVGKLDSTSLETLVADGVIDHIYLTFPPRESAHVQQVLRILRHLPIEVSWILDPIEVGWVLKYLPGARALNHVDTHNSGLPVLRLLQRPLDGWRYIFKCTEDRILAAVALVFVAPMMLAIAVAVKLDSPGPILYRQLRRGFSRQSIKVLKFRTMYIEHCDTVDHIHLKQVTRGDTRVTRLGRILRRTSLDELPQLINVLMGEMSIVGPRPHAVSHDAYYANRIDNYLERHRVRPGMTGWAQVCGCRGETKTIDEMRRRIEFDIEYIDNWSIWLDFKIIFQTVIIVALDRNAY